MSDNEINVSQLNKTFGLTDAEREEFRVFIKVLEGVMERHGRDATTEQVLRYLHATLDRKPLTAAG